MALNTRHGQMPAFKGISLAVPHRPQQARNKTLAMMAVEARRVAFGKLTLMRVGMTTATLIRSAHIFG